MAKNRIEYLNQIELKVKDIAGELAKTAITTGTGIYNGSNTSMPVASSAGFCAGDEVYIYGGAAYQKITFVISLSDEQHIELDGNLSDFPSGSVIKKTEATAYLDEAVTLYSKYRTQQKLETVLIEKPGKVFDLPLSWQNGFSSVISIEYPVDETVTSIIPQEDYEVVLCETGSYTLRFKYELSNAYRICYTIPHSFDNTNNPPLISVPDIDFYCICSLAAGLYLLALANRYGQSVNGGLTADSVNYDKKSDEYRKLAKEMFSFAANWLGIPVSAIDEVFLGQSPGSSDQQLGSQDSIFK
jgi:hypothetical protein